MKTLWHCLPTEGPCPCHVAFDPLSQSRVSYFQGERYFPLGLVGKWGFEPLMLVAMPYEYEGACVCAHECSSLHTHPTTQPHPLFLPWRGFDFELSFNIPCCYSIMFQTLCHNKIALSHYGYDHWYLKGSICFYLKGRIRTILLFCNLSETI